MIISNINNCQILKALFKSQYVQAPNWFVLLPFNLFPMDGVQKLDWLDEMGLLSLLFSWQL